MDITSVLAVICSAVVFLAWLALPGSKPSAKTEIHEAPAPMDIPVSAEPASLTA